jgi:type II secretory pathway pseudopilin PulG
MKHDQKGFGAVEILLIIVVIGVTGLAGFLVYSRGEDKKDRERLEQQISELRNKDDDSNSDKRESATTISDDDAILLAVDCKARIKEGNECSIAEKRDNLARVMAGGAMGGAQIILAKENTKWSIVYQGNGDVPQETVNKYKIPESWLGPSV